MSCYGQNLTSSSYHVLKIQALCICPVTLYLVFHTVKRSESDIYRMFLTACGAARTRASTSLSAAIKGWIHYASIAAQVPKLISAST